MRVVIRQLKCGTWEATEEDPVGMAPAGHGKNWKEALGDFVSAYPDKFGIPVTGYVSAIRVFKKDGQPYDFKTEYERER
jgi:hypothetical protein